jgi:hypothetical protein
VQSHFERYPNPLPFPSPLEVSINNRVRGVSREDISSYSTSSQRRFLCSLLEYLRSMKRRSGNDADSCIPSIVVKLINGNKGRE